LRRVLLLELGILGAALKKVLKGMVLVTQHLGQNGTVGFTEPRALALLESRDLAGNINAPQALTVLLIRLGTALKGMIPDMPRTAEVLRKLLLLSTIWIKAEFVCLANHGAILGGSPKNCRDPVHSLRYPSFRANFKDGYQDCQNLSQLGVITPIMLPQCAINLAGLFRSSH
jgi:hypothetical protein